MSIAQWVGEAPERLRQRVNQGIRRSAGLTQDPPAICEDPELAFTRVDAVARLVHGDLPSMMVGGLASLFFEMLHPHSMAGVAQHSRYRDDPLGRVLQTANFIGVTTYGPRDRAEAAIERVRAIHEGVRGVADDGRPYRAGDPHLLEWIHCAGSAMFLAAYERYGARPLVAHEADEYVDDVAATATALGAERVPHSVAELRDQIDAFRPELRLSPEGAEARDFILRGVHRAPAQRAAYRLLVEAALGLLEPWAREGLALEAPPAPAAALVAPATRLLARGIRLAVPPAVPPRWRG